MVSVGIDVSKGKSMVAATSPQGVVIHAFEVQHNTKDIDDLISRIKSLKDNDVHIIIESTGRYHEAIAHKLYESGFFVIVRNPKLTSNYDNDSLRSGKTDKIDSLKLARYGLEKWNKLERYVPWGVVYTSLKDLNRQIAQYSKQLIASKNNLTSLLDVVYPDVARLFKSKARKDGHQKWMDFVMTFWHCKCVSSMSEKAFCDKYRAWCKRKRYNYSQAKAEQVYQHARSCAFSKPKNESVKIMITTAVAHVLGLQVDIQTLKNEMQSLAKTLPEFSVLISMHGVGDDLGSQLIAEMGDIRRFSNKRKLVAYAGIDPPDYQSGQFQSKNRHMSKRGPALLRQGLFLVMRAILVNARKDDSVFKFLDRKRAEGKHYLSYMMAGSNKFLQIYYAKVHEYLDGLGLWAEEVI